jgi:hypothetical protein
LSKRSDKSYRRNIDKNGMVVKSIVIRKKYAKGRYVVFEYEYKGRQFTNEEQSRTYYENLRIGEAIEIKIDTTNPNDSYIFAAGTK